MKAFFFHCINFVIVSIGSVWAEEESVIIDYRSRFHPVVGKNGIVSSQESRASEVGLKILKDGGNAIDSAIGVAYALAVTLPKAGNIGGGGFMIVYSAKDKRSYAFDFREMAPLAATSDMYLNEEGEVDERRARFSPQSVGVPGTVKGLAAVHDKFGTKRMSELIQPAVSLAQNGFSVSAGLAMDLVRYEEKLKSNPTIANIFYKENGEPFGLGETLVQADLAWSLKQISVNGEAAFYKGAIADKLVDFMDKEDGLVTHEDLENYKVVERAPLVGSYKGFEVVSMPPPSSGGLHLIQMLNTVERTSLKKMGHNSADSIHHLAEAMKYAYADRSAHLGDPDFVSVPVDWLTSKEYGKEIFDRIVEERSTPSEVIKPGEPVEYESEETTHFSVMDREGNAVSCTYTINFSFGSLQMAPGTGFILNNEMDDFSAKTGAVNGMGLMGGEANAIRPKKRPLSSMTPTIVLKNGEPYLVTGSPGGGKIITTVLQTVLNVVEFGMNIAEASSVPRVHHQWLPDELRCESGISVDTLRRLQLFGYQTESTLTLGATQSVMKVRGRFEGASDPRRPDSATVAY